MGGEIKHGEAKVELYLDEVLADWLESKALEGYKKAAIVRNALYMYMKMDLDEATKKEQQREKDKKQQRIEEGEHGPEQRSWR